MAAKAPVKKNLSAMKRARQAEKRNARNRTVKTRLKNVVKEVETSVRTGKPEESLQALRTAVKAISSASSKGIIHKNTAARKISRLSKRVNASAKA